MDPPLLDVRLGDQIKRVRAVLVMGAVLGDGKAMTCCVPGDVLVPNHASVPSYVYPLSCCLRHPAFSLDKLCSHRTSHKGSYV
jgi:hypothetical protein